MTNSPHATTADREIVITRTIDGPRELVFEAFTDVRHLSRWWGPNGFTTTTRAFAFREGGAWDFVMHAPDGSDYPNWITWREITPPERISLIHGESAQDPDAFESILTFADHGETTEITMRTVFPTAACATGRSRNTTPSKVAARHSTVWQQWWTVASGPTMPPPLSTLRDA